MLAYFLSLVFKININLDHKMSIDRRLVRIDCDPGIDDAFALVLAGHSNELEVLGVSIVAGNASVATTTRNGLKVL